MFYCFLFFGPDDIVSVLSLVHSVASAFDKIIRLFMLFGNRMIRA